MPETFKTSREAAKGGPLNLARQQGIELNPIVPDNWFTRFSHQVQQALGIAKIEPLVNDDPLKVWVSRIFQQ